jgi:hypothetical protein
MSVKLKVVLENIRIASPCSADWDEMTGTDAVRFCGQCEKNVYNLSAMTRAEAEALVTAKDSKMCVRLYQRKDGTVLTQDCPVGVRRLRIRSRLWATVTGATATAALMLGVVSGRAWADTTVAPCHKPGQAQAQKPPHPKMGEIAVFVPPAPSKPTPKMGKIKRPEPALMGDISAE